MLTFQFLNDKIHQTPILPNHQVSNGFSWYKCKFYHLKIEKLILSFSHFSLATGFLKGNEIKYFTHVPGLSCKKNYDASDKISTHCIVWL